MELALDACTCRKKVNVVATALSTNGLKLGHRDPFSKQYAVTSLVHCAHTLLDANK
jgi:hypothetical protein